jgi:two-component system LytT family response regulator
MGTGLLGTSNTHQGVYGISQQNHGVHGQSDSGNGFAGVYGAHGSSGLSGHIEFTSTIEELRAAVHRFLESSEDYRQQYELLKNIMHNMQAPSAEEFRLALPTKEGVHFLVPQDIIRCEAMGNYTRFFATNNRRYIISRTLAEYDALLTPYNFIRTHKSHLVNKNHISFIDHDGFVVLKDGTKVEVSRRRKPEVLSAMM